VHAEDRAVGQSRRVGQSGGKAGVPRAAVARWVADGLGH
jgi:hypothetical protein